MANDTPRVAVLIANDVARDPVARTKNKPFYDALSRRFRLVGVFNAGLTGWRWLVNALQVAHPNRRYWLQRRYANVPAFRACSRRAAKYLKRIRGQADVILQDGVFFDALSEGSVLPNVIYTDSTACLSAREPAAGRSPFTVREREQWLALERAAMQRAAHVCTWSGRAQASVIADYGISPARVTAVGGGLNLDELPDVDERPPSVEPTALFIGSEFHRKGGDLVLAAFARVRSRMPNARLLFLTAKPIPEGMPIEGVEVVPWAWDRAMVMSLYRRADVFVLPSRLETWGDVLLEAMAYELPCIGVAGQPMEEIIEHERTGLVVPPNDVEWLAAAMMRLLGDPSLRRDWGRAGRRRVETRFTWDHVVERLAPPLIAASHEKEIRIN